MSMLKKLQDKKKHLQDKLVKSKTQVEMRRAEKIRKKIRRAKYYKPGTFRYGLYHRQSISDFMKDVKERRENKMGDKKC